MFFNHPLPHSPTLHFCPQVSTSLSPPPQISSHFSYPFTSAPLPSSHSLTSASPFALAQSHSAPISFLHVHTSSPRSLPLTSALTFLNTLGFSSPAPSLALAGTIFTRVIIFLHSLGGSRPITTITYWYHTLPPGKETGPGGVKMVR